MKNQNNRHKVSILQGQNIKRDLLLVPPKESGDENNFWQLDKAVYRLNDAT